MPRLTWHAVFGLQLGFKIQLRFNRDKTWYCWGTWYTFACIQCVCMLICALVMESFVTLREVLERPDLYHTVCEDSDGKVRN